MSRTPRAVLPPLPWTLKLGVTVWLMVGVLFLIAAGSFLVSAQLQELDRAGLIALGVLMAALAGVQLFLVFWMRRGKRSGRELLTTVGVIAGIPVLVRGTPGLSVIAVVMLLALVLLWLPPSNAWFQRIDAKPPNKWVRLVSRTLSPFKR